MFEATQYSILFGLCSHARNAASAIDQRVVKADLRGIGIGVGEINAGEPGPVDGSQAHGTRLAGSVDLAAFKIEDAKFLAGIANGADFGMRGGIVGGSNLIRAFGNNRAVFHNDRAEGATASRVDVIDRELNGAGHERIVHVFARRL
jgi:hypothetical protein